MCSCASVAPRARAFPSLCLLLKLEVKGSTQKAQKEKGARAPVSLLVSDLAGARGAEQLPDKIRSCDCRNSLRVLGKQAEGMQQLRKEVTSLVAELRSVKKVTRHLGKRAGMSRTPQRILSWGCWCGFSPHSAPHSSPGVELLL